MVELNRAVSRSETAQHSLVVRWGEPQVSTSPHSALSQISLKLSLTEPLVQHQLAFLLVTQQNRRCCARHGQQHKSTKMQQLLGPRDLHRNFCSLRSLLLLPSLLLLVPVSYCLPSACPLPSITSLYLPHHHLHRSNVQVFTVSGPNPQTGCSYSSAASSPGRKKFQYFNICCHPKLGRKTEIRDSL